MEESILYTDTAGVGRPHSSVVEKQHAYNKAQELQGKMGVKNIAQDVMSDLKSGIATLLNCSADNIAITGNTSEGINTIASGYDLHLAKRRF